jgi:hypothetical protein
MFLIVTLRSRSGRSDGAGISAGISILEPSEGSVGKRRGVEMSIGLGSPLR